MWSCYVAQAGLDQQETNCDNTVIKITPSGNSSVQAEVQVKIQRKKDASHAWGPAFLGMMSGDEWLGPSGQQEWSAGSRGNWIFHDSLY